MFCGIITISFSDFVDISKNDRDMLVQITSYSEHEIIKQLEENDYENYVSYTEFAIQIKQLGIYLATQGNIEMKKLIYKCDLESNLRAPVLELVKSGYFGRKLLLTPNTFHIMLSAFTVDNHAICETKDGKNLIPLNHSYKWLDKEVWDALKGEPVRVVMGVGDPIAQNIALMYQICENDFWDLDEYWKYRGGVYKRFLTIT